MRKLWKYSLLLLSVILIIVTISSCFPASGPKVQQAKSVAHDSKKVTLRFINSWGGNDSKADTLQKVFDKFMKDNQGVEVINESMFGDDFLPKIKSDFASGNNPDVFGLWPGSDIRALIGVGKVADLTDILEADKNWKNTFDKKMWSYTTFNNKIYGLPVEIIFECLFINKDIFEKYDVKVPETYDELKQAVTVFRSHGITPIAYNSLAEGTYLYQNIAAMLGGKEAVEHPFNSGGISDCYLEAAEYMKELYKLGAFPDDFLYMTSAERNNLFKSKKAAMIVQGSWFLGESEFKNPASKVEIIRFPHFAQGKASESSMIYGLGCGTFYMSKSTSEDNSKEEFAVKLLKTLTSAETVSMFAEQTGMISNVGIDVSSVDYNRLTKRGNVLLNNSSELIGPPDSYIDRSVWEDIIVKKFPYVLEGKKTASDLWSEAITAGVGVN